MPSIGASRISSGTGLLSFSTSTTALGTGPVTGSASVSSAAPAAAAAGANTTLTLTAPASGVALYDTLTQSTASTPNITLALRNLMGGANISITSANGLITIGTTVIVGPTGPTGPSGGATGPTGPTGPAPNIVPSKFTSASVTATVFTPGQITGAEYVTFMSTNASPGTLTTRTATLMFNDYTPAISAGYSYNLRLVNTGAGSLTLAGGTGVTLTGTMTVATNTTRDFNVTFPTTTTCTIQTIGTGTYS